ncbi:NAD(P)-dependent dehydrogenase, short-chain alcohol dehydrogenase family [Flagellimonas taeanensis]|uniref:NAD(P)-dependent dehydrogenase, short-chain alcohol dehydrogenase family n=1 Tax=Flagellimonas taeanensis TaxID=1005926 RepID=A0A1M6TRX3_9FLAO|nr:SDR family oxidoreductase [Allomuricauda taeanensis]SFB90120.1 NAD(P)-dependent dehydrogenase, short-chain alcohol dehydrogenase family [Allomuricauda taeanensis]SHK59687.1 NAD(P)-dependent dehydrogenase, short-chain alcohol dehydrogenase family [Allomuricauda taeanensis]
MSKNKIALVTGGSRGLGENMAINLAKKGLDVVLTYQSNKVEADKTAQEIESLGQKAYALQLDVSQVDNFDTFVNQVKKVIGSHFEADYIDYLINNAGIGINAMITETTQEQFDTLVDIHFKGAFFLTQKLLPIMADGGGIVNISSGLARFSFPGYSVYGALKAAMETLTRYQAKELGARQIRSNVVAPGAIETDFGGGTNKTDEGKRAAIANFTALGRVGIPSDIGGVVAFLCTEDAKWVNAQRIEVSGGMMI